MRRRLGKEGLNMKQKVYITIAGTNYYHGRDFLEPGMKVRLIKEPDNEHDREAIRVEMDGLGKIGYVANSPWTVQGESLSAGRLYDRIGDTARAKVKFIGSRIVVKQSQKRGYYIDITTALLFGAVYYIISVLRGGEKGCTGSAISRKSKRGAPSASPTRPSWSGPLTWTSGTGSGSGVARSR